MYFFPRATLIKYHQLKVLKRAKSYCLTVVEALLTKLVRLLTKLVSNLVRLLV